MSRSMRWGQVWNCSFKIDERWATAVASGATALMRHP
jgi:hypothetical protein